MLRHEWVRALKTIKYGKSGKTCGSIFREPGGNDFNYGVQQPNIPLAYTKFMSEKLMPYVKKKSESKKLYRFKDIADMHRIPMIKSALPEHQDQRALSKAWLTFASCIHRKKDVDNLASNLHEIDKTRPLDMIIDAMNISHILFPESNEAKKSSNPCRIKDEKSVAFSLNYLFIQMSQTGRQWNIGIPGNFPKDQANSLYQKRLVILKSWLRQFKSEFEKC